MSKHLGFVTWDRDRPTGGNVYNQNLVDDLRALGVDVRLHRLAGAWPEGDPSTHAQLARALREAPASLVDGIVACGAPDVITEVVKAGNVIIIVLHLPISDELGLDARKRERYAVLEARALQAASGVLCSSRWSADQLSRRFGRHDVGVAVPGVRPAPVARGSLDTGIPHFLTVASLTPTKDQLTLVRALARLADLPWTAGLIGSDTAARGYAARVRTEITSAGLLERITVPGMLADPALEKEWDACDLLVLPSRTETYGLVIGEALSRGIPAVVPADTGAVEALGQGATSRDNTVPGAALLPGDPVSLAALLHRWLTEPTLRRTWRQAALDRRDTLPGWRQTAEAVLAYLERPQNPPSTRTGSPPESQPTPPLAPQQ
ncbi:MAG TPA: glycosyltransferase family 4 protein [Propionibacteriaceae bacterium]|nr:glycosyltransferase family 4 protein [Propionibacteriaceae bacterium]